MLFNNFAHRRTNGQLPTGWIFHSATNTVKLGAVVFANTQTGKPFHTVLQDVGQIAESLYVIDCRWPTK